MTSAVIRQEHRQQQTLTPRLQQAVRLLQLSSLDFAQEVQQAMGTNPFLEVDETDNEYATDGQSPTVAEAPPVAVDAQIASPTEAGQDSQQDQSWDTERWSQSSSRRNGSGDGDFDFADITPADVSLREHLRSQLYLLPSSDRDRAVMNTIVEAIDDDGYLRVDLQEMRSLSGLDPEPDDDELNIALKLVQSLDPAGVGARDIKECLLLQLRETETPDHPEIRELAARIVTDHMDLLAMHDCAGLARRLGGTVEAIQQASDSIRRLEPRPGWRFGASSTRFVVPDVVVRKFRGEWTVKLNNSIVPRVRLNRMYADLFQSHRDSSHSDLASQLQEARWTVRNVEQRFATIVRVAEEIVKRQRHFFDYGELAMRPLGLREIADALGLHESTVSRVTNNKYMATPLGVFELKYFFSRGLATVSGGSCSATAIRGAIKDLIASESARTPMSDAHIARLLARQGLKVARRTVTKYRQSMKVPAYEMRRRQA